MIIQLNSGDTLEVADELTNEGRLAFRVCHTETNWSSVNEVYAFLSLDDTQRLAGHLISFFHKPGVKP